MVLTLLCQAGCKQRHLGGELGEGLTLLLAQALAVLQVQLQGGDNSLRGGSHGDEWRPHGCIARERVTNRRPDSCTFGRRCGNGLRMLYKRLSGKYGKLIFLLFFSSSLGDLGWSVEDDEQDERGAVKMALDLSHGPCRQPNRCMLTVAEGEAVFEIAARAPCANLPRVAKLPSEQKPQHTSSARAA